MTPPPPARPSYASPDVRTAVGPRSFAPLLVLAGTLLLAAGAAYFVGRTTGLEERIRFAAAARNVLDAVDGRLKAHVGVLRGGTGLFAAEGAANGAANGGAGVTREQFAAYVGRVDLGAAHRGIQGIGFARRSTGPDGNDTYRVEFLEPLDERNRAALGFDMFAEPTRRAAMERARDEGMPAATGKVTLVQEIDADKQPGFLIYVPVYRNGHVPGMAEHRRRDVIGFVYSPFRAGDLFRDVGGRESLQDLPVTYAVYDGTDVMAGSLLYESDDGAGDGGGKAPVITRQVSVAGRPWTIVFRPRGGIAPGTGVVPGLGVLACGLVLSVLLFAVTRSQVAARRSAEQSAAGLRKSQRALAASEARLRRLVEANVIGVMLAELDGRILEANDAFLRLLGYGRREFADSGANWVDLTPPDCRAADERAVSELRATGRHDPYEKAFVRRDGGRVPVLVGMASLGPDPDLAQTAPGAAGGSSAIKDSGTFRNVGVGFVVDLTDRKRAEDERSRLLDEAYRSAAAEQSARREAEEANRVKDEFLATLSHELRTPLNAILGWAQLLRIGRLDAQETEQGLETIERNAKAQAQLVDDLLDLSRIISGKLRLEVKSVNLAAVVEAALETVRPAADAKGIGLVPVLDDRAGPATGDAGRLQQVVWNLLSNAIKFTGRGGTVRVLLRRADGPGTPAGGGDYAEIVVADTGQGIDPAFLPHVFERLRQADASTTRRHGGLGLGLAIVRHLVELHGGAVRVDSPGPGQGATFAVLLPVAALRPAPAAVPAREDESAGPTPAPSASNGRSLAGLRVLVVDDEADARDLLGLLLRRQGADVTVAGSAAEALAALAVARPDVLVSDIGMPDEDGYALIRKVRSLDPTAGGCVPAIALTAFARAEDRRRAVEAGFQSHVAKPVEAGDLIAVVAELAGQAVHDRLPR